MNSTIKLLCEFSKRKTLPIRIFRNPCGTYYAIVFNFREEFCLTYRSRNFSSYEMIEKHLFGNGMKKIHLCLGGVAYV